MTRYGEEFIITDRLMEEIVSYMDDNIREKVHFEFAPCTHEEFLRRYIVLDPEYEDTLKSEFGLEV